MAPDDRTHAHRAGFAGGVQRRALERVGARIIDRVADRHHLAMCSRIAEAMAMIAPARDNAARVNDDGAEWQVRGAPLIDRHAHEALVHGF